MKHLLLGDEAIAQGAIDAGLSGVYAYPGTPSTEITEYIQIAESKKSQDANHQPIFCRWATNEKTAMEAAMGMSYAGKRALVCMKHVGMNVCADAFMNTAITGVNGGLVVLAADDPSMHSSQNEQDSRFYAKFALIPCFEPSNQQEAYDMIRAAFELSEQLHYPILMRVTTRMAHSRAVVETREAEAQKTMVPAANPKHFILLPAMSRLNYRDLLAAQKTFVQASETSGYNTYVKGTNPKRAIVTTGIAYNYLMENYQGGASVLKIAQYPLPEGMIEQMVKDGAEEILVIEEGQPVVEELLAAVLYNAPYIQGKGPRIVGRLTGALPRDGELTPDSVRQAIGLAPLPVHEEDKIVVGRPPAMCQGCGHRDMYAALNEVVAEYGDKARVFGDIGCYTLGALPPYQALHATVEMGASITMAKGAADAGLHPAIAVIGDSTFTHSGMTGLLDCVNSKANVVVIISDNLTTGMTGGQDSAGTGRIENICTGLGVEPEHVRVVVPLPKNMEEIKQVLREEISYAGPSVMIARRECIQTLKRHLKAAKK